MLRVTIEMVPGGDETRKRVIGRAEISNVLELAELSDYVAQFSSTDERGVTRTATVQTRRFERNRWSAWRLLYRLLNNLDGAEIMRR